MKDLTDRDYLLQRQYCDAGNLQARIAVHRRFSTNPQGLPRWFMEQLQIPEHGRILEVGCGPGSNWVEMAERIPSSWQITLSDFSSGMVQQAQRNLAALPRPFTVVQADVQSLPFSDASFDAVIANFMLYHVPDLPRALAEIHRVLLPGGRLYAMTNGRAHMREFDAMVNCVVPGAVRAEGTGFSLENGPALIAPWFDRVQVVRYPDSLRITEAEPLLAYIRSYATHLDGDQEQALRREIEAGIGERGALTITKDPGMVTGVTGTTTPYD